MNYKHLAIKFGEAAKTSATLNEIGRTFSSLTDLKKKHYPNEYITSSRSQTVYSWVMTIASSRVSKQGRKKIIREAIKELIDNKQERSSLMATLEGADSTADLPKAYLGRTLRVFLSYSTKDKDLAGTIKAQLENKFGLEVFLAHEDIQPSVEWQDEIIRNLEAADIFIPVLTKDFKASEWADQESGLAFSHGKIVVPLAIDMNPYGFLSRYQALRFDESDPASSCEKIVNAIKEKYPKYEESLIDSLIRALANSRSFDDAGYKASLLAKVKLFSKDQINEVVRVSLENSQVRGSFKARRILKTLTEKHKKLIDKGVMRKFKEEYYPKPEKKDIDPDAIPF